MHMFDVVNATDEGGGRSKKLLQRGAVVRFEQGFERVDANPEFCGVESVGYVVEVADRL